MVCGWSWNLCGICGRQSEAASLWEQNFAESDLKIDFLKTSKPRPLQGQVPPAWLPLPMTRGKILYMLNAVH